MEVRRNLQAKGFQQSWCHSIGAHGQPDREGERRPGQGREPKVTLESYSGRSPFSLLLARSMTELKPEIHGS